MNVQENAMPEPFGSRVTTPASMPVFTSFRWSVLRELWENRFIYLAPLGAAALFLVGFAIHLAHLRHTFATSPLGVGRHQDLFGTRYGISAVLIMGTAFIVGIFYCLDALYGERRDRSILFWKSLPVSDTTAVLSKVTIPLVVL